MKKQLREKIVMELDDLIILIQSAARENEIPMLQADEIIDELLDARVATTATAPKDPNEPAKAAA